MNITPMTKNKKLDYYYNLCREKWWNSNSCFELHKKEISYSEKKIREKRFDELVDMFVNHIILFKDFESDEDIKIWNDNLDKIIDKFLENGYIFGIDFDEKLRNNFFKVTKKFVNDAKSFDENISLNDIGQAMRNVWIINILQALMEEKIELTKAVFGYSLLYPYTDNYLDDVEVKLNDKKQFNDKLYQKLKGEAVTPLNEHEGKVYKLVENIESVFSRNKYHDLYESIIEIQNGQVKSLNQQNELIIPYERDILGISIEKGGASVLVDGYLVNGELTSEEIEFCIGYGVLLQFADDLQDVKEDLDNNHMTIMSQLAGNYKLDPIVNKLMDFTINVIDDFQKQGQNQRLDKQAENERLNKQIESEKLGRQQENQRMDKQGQNQGFKKEVQNHRLKNMIKDNCIMLILFSAALSKEFFSKEYIKEKEKYLPFTMEYIGKLKKNLRKRLKKLNNIKDKDEKIKQIVNTITRLD